MRLEAVQGVTAAQYDQAIGFAAAIREWMRLGPLTPIICFGLLVASAGPGLTAPKHLPRDAGPQVPEVSILYVDSAGAVLRCTPPDGAASPVSHGGLLVMPYAIAILSDNQIVVSDTGVGALVSVDVKTSKQSILARSEILGVPYGMAADGQVQVFVANGRSVVSVNARNGNTEAVASGGPL